MMRIIDFFWKGNDEFHKSIYNVYFRIDLKNIVAKYILQYILTTVTMWNWGLLLHWEEVGPLMMASLPTYSLHHTEM